MFLVVNLVNWEFPFPPVAGDKGIYTMFSGNFIFKLWGIFITSPEEKDFDDFISTK